jgi:hypothetical protein
MPATHATNCHWLLAPDASFVAHGVSSLCIQLSKCLDYCMLWSQPAGPPSRVFSIQWQLLLHMEEGALKEQLQAL